MRRRLLGAMLLIAVVALAGFGVPLALSVQARYRDDALLTLSAEAATAAVAVPGSYAGDHDLPELPDPARNVDVALYDQAGQRLVGEGPDRADQLVAAALRTGASQRDRGALVVAIPVSQEEVVVGAIRTSLPNRVVADRVHRTWAAMGALAGGVFAVAGLVSLERSRSLSAPLHRLRADAELIGDGGEIPSRSPSGIEEIDTVHTTLTEAAGRLNDVLALERAFSADLAHQLRTPLASLRLRLETAEEGPHSETELVPDALRDVDRLERTIDDLIALARDVRPSGEARPLATLVRDAARRWEAAVAAAGRTLAVQLEPELPFVRARCEAVRQILDVLIDNAVTHGAGTITLTGTRVGSGAVIAIADQARTIIDPHEIFSRRSDNASGSGIGLALARRLAEAEDLRLVVANRGPGVVLHLVFGGPPTNSPKVRTSSS